jgi:hypothetical protein
LFKKQSRHFHDTFVTSPDPLNFVIAVVKKTASALAASLALSTLLVACGGGSDDTPSVPRLAASVSDNTQFFNRVATFAVCEQIGSSCEARVATAAEIVAASTDGMTLIYTNSPKDEVGFVDITDPSAPVALGALAMGGEPTSITVQGNHALIAVNTSPSFTAPDGKLVVVDIATRQVVHEIALGGQPDSIAISKDGKYVAVVIENERDEDLGDGTPPQLPGGKLVIVDAVGAPNTWQTRDVALTNLAMLYPTDPEPEYVSINDNNVAVVTLQENNHLVLVDLATGKVTRDFAAGQVSLTQIDLTDERPNQVNLTENLSNRLREPDGVTWVSTSQFVTANEGDLDGGSRGFTLFNTDGSVAYDAGNTMEHLMARIGHTNDKRSDAKGNEPENVAAGRFDRTDYLFVASERSSVLAVYDLSSANQPTLKQVLPSAQAPEGVLTIPSRNLVITASEETDPVVGKPSIFAALNIYQYQKAASSYPTIESVNRTDGTPIPWSALSGLAAAPTGSLLYAIDDAFFKGNRIFEIDTSVTPAKLQREIRITDPNGLIAALATSLPDTASSTAFDDTDLPALVNTADQSVNIDPEGIAIASATYGGGFWIASEGALGKSANLIFKVSATGVIENIIQLPADVNAKQTSNGFEGIAEADGKLVVAFQLPWTGDMANHARIGVYDLTTQTWSFMFYPLDVVTSANGGWVGLSEIMALGNNRFAVIERDNQAGPDATIKKIYRIDLTGKVDGNVLSKTLVRDVLPDLRATRGHVLEKIEGLARLADGNVYLVNDNDGLDKGNGETQLIKLGKIFN